MNTQFKIHFESILTYTTRCVLVIMCLVHRCTTKWYGFILSFPQTTQELYGECISYFSHKKHLFHALFQHEFINRYGLQCSYRSNHILILLLYLVLWCHYGDQNWNLCFCSEMSFTEINIDIDIQELGLWLNMDYKIVSYIVHKKNSLMLCFNMCALFGAQSIFNFINSSMVNV